MSSTGRPSSGAESLCGGGPDRACRRARPELQRPLFRDDDDDHQIRLDGFGGVVRAAALTRRPWRADEGDGQLVSAEWGADSILTPT